jgi:superoxide dismutase, Cu-Zn family
MMRKIVVVGLLIAGGVGCSGDNGEVEVTEGTEAEHGATATPTGATGEARPAVAVLRNRAGDEVGQVNFTQEGEEVVIAVNARNLEGGQRAIHIHAVGRCEGPDFQSAGGHFNPENRAHGLENPEGPHAGDLRNLVVDPDDNIGHDTYRNSRVTLRQGAPNSLLGGEGTSVVIHAGADDNVSQPAGNAGDRIVCGVITAA